MLALIVVCAIATFRTEHMATASGYTLGPSTNVGDTAYADMLKADTGQSVGYGGPPPGGPPPPSPPPPPPQVMVERYPAVCPSGAFVAGKGCIADDGMVVEPHCSKGTYIPDPMNAQIGMCETRTDQQPNSLPPPFPQEPPQCPPRRPFVPGKGCMESNGKISQPMCFDGATYIPDPQGKDIGSCSAPKPKKETQNRAPPAEGPPGGYTSEGTPARVAPAALNGLQLGGPNDGGIGRSSGGSGSASWGGSGVKYPNLLGPNPKKADFPDTNPSAISPEATAARLTLPTPCQVGADGNTLYSPGCRAPTDLGYFTVPTIPKTEGVPSPFSEDYTVFMK